jgi:hypothetical protein
MLEEFNKIVYDKKLEKNDGKKPRISQEELV